MHQQLTEPDRAVLAQLLELKYSKTKIARLVLVVPTAFWRQPSPQPSPAICALRSPVFVARERGPNNVVVWLRTGVERVRSTPGFEEQALSGLPDHAHRCALGRSGGLRALNSQHYRDERAVGFFIGPGRAYAWRRMCRLLGRLS